MNLSGNALGEFSVGVDDFLVFLMFSQWVWYFGVCFMLVSFAGLVLVLLVVCGGWLWLGVMSVCFVLLVVGACGVFLVC